MLKKNKKESNLDQNSSSNDNSEFRINAFGMPIIDNKIQ